jgi:hypothetical protein
MFVDVCLLTTGGIRWARLRPRPGALAGALLTATTASVLTASITLATTGDPSHRSAAFVALPVAGGLLAVLAHLCARPPPRDAETVAAARALAPRSRRAAPRRRLRWAGLWRS